MELFKDFEKQALALLLSEAFPGDRLTGIFAGAEFEGYEYTGSGYFLEVRHMDLPMERVVYSSPIVVGRAEGVTCGFVAFTENKRLTLECHTWGETNVPNDFRDRDVKVKEVAIEEGQFVDLNGV